LTAVGFAIGGGPWGVVVVATFAVTLFSGLTLKFGVHRFTAAVLLNVWFLIAISVPAGEHLDLARSDWWGTSPCLARGCRLVDHLHPCGVAGPGT